MSLCNDARKTVALATTVAIALVAVIVLVARGEINFTDYFFFLGAAPTVSDMYLAIAAAAAGALLHTLLAFQPYDLDFSHFVVWYYVFCTLAITFASSLFVYSPLLGFNSSSSSAFTTRQQITAAAFNIVVAVLAYNFISYHRCRITGEVSLSADPSRARSVSAVAVRQASVASVEPPKAAANKKRSTSKGKKRKN